MGDTMSKIMKFTLAEITATDIEWVQLIRTGKFPYGYDDEFEITKEVLREFKLNFDRKARRVELAVDYFHENLSIAAGWFQEIELRENDSQLWIRVDWTDAAKEKILGKELRYLSAEFHLKYKDEETNVEYGATLYGAGLTNRPHVKDMQAMFSETSKLKTQKKDITMPEFNDILEAVGSLSEDEKLQLGEKLGFSKKASEGDDEAVAKLAAAETAKTLAEDSVKEKTTEVVTLTAKVTELSTKFSELEKTNAEKDKTILFNEMLTNSTAVEAQRDAYMKGDITKFAENAVAGINLKPTGSSAGSNDDTVNVATAKFNELSNALSEDEGIDPIEAAKRIARENPTIAASLTS